MRTCALAVVAAVASPGAAVKWFEGKRKILPFSLAPGVSLTVVSREGQKIAASGDATEHSLLEIGSLSKTMIALGLATLVDQGDLAWDAKVHTFFDASFSFGSDDWVTQHLTIRDLLTHRSGLAEGQGDLIGGLYPSEQLPQLLGGVTPGNEFREVFDYSNVGWALAGEVLRVASNSSSWCEALHSRVWGPLNMTETFCDRNDVSAEKEALVANVSKVSPCDGHAAAAPFFRRNTTAAAPHLRTYTFVRTGARGSFAWGAADAAGSVLSTPADMGKVMALLLGKLGGRVVQLDTLEEMQRGQMAVGVGWLETCGIRWDQASGVAAGAGLGFDVAARLPVQHMPAVMQGAAYWEKSGDTNMHKARLGALPERGIAVLLLSNLGGEVGGPLTALKFGALAVAAGATEEEADELTAQVLETTGYWENQWVPGATCTECGTVAFNGPCVPGHQQKPPQALASYEGTYADDFYGDAMQLTAKGEVLSMQFGPVDGPLSFGVNNQARQAPCKEVAETQPAWNRGTLPLTGSCMVTEFSAPLEIPAGGISDANSTVAFPAGCGFVPLPDAMSVLVITQGKSAWALVPGMLVLLERRPSEVVV